MPTVGEMRSIAWQAIAAGANGLVFYSYFDILKRGRPKDVQDAQWADLVAVAREIKAQEAILLAEPGPAVEEVPDGMACRTWRTADGKVHYLVCNTARKPLKGSIRIEDNRHDIDLPPIGVLIQ